MSSPDHSVQQPGADWKMVCEYQDIRFERSDDGIAKITICRP